MRRLYLYLSARRAERRAVREDRRAALALRRAAEWRAAAAKFSSRLLALHHRRHPE